MTPLDPKIRERLERLHQGISEAKVREREQFQAKEERRRQYVLALLKLQDVIPDLNSGTLGLSPCVIHKPSNFHFEIQISPDSPDSWVVTKAPVDDKGDLPPGMADNPAALQEFVVDLFEKHLKDQKLYADPDGTTTAAGRQDQRTTPKSPHRN
jgi:hypothetical protein